MELKGINIGFALTGSFCTFEKTINVLKDIKKEGANIIPIMYYNAYNLDTRFGKASDFIKIVEKITGNKIIHTIQDAEPIGPKKLTDIMVIAPATSNTISKLANGINDTPVTMATKSHFIDNKPVLIGISTNDALGANGENIGKLLNTRNYYFVPFNQDNPISKPRSIVFKPEYLIESIKKALDNEQIEPIIV